MAKPQKAKESIYKKRIPKDSRLNPNKTIAEQFNLLRVVDSTMYPAYLGLNGWKYSLKIDNEHEVKKGRKSKSENI